MTFKILSKNNKLENKFEPNTFSLNFHPKLEGTSHWTIITTNESRGLDQSTHKTINYKYNKQNIKDAEGYRSEFTCNGTHVRSGARLPKSNASVGSKLTNQNQRYLFCFVLFSPLRFPFLFFFFVCFVSSRSQASASSSSFPQRRLLLLSA